MLMISMIIDSAYLSASSYTAQGLIGSIFLRYVPGRGLIRVSSYTSGVDASKES
jgi:hypothetical protein